MTNSLTQSKSKFNIQTFILEEFFEGDQKIYESFVNASPKCVTHAISGNRECYEPTRSLKYCKKYAVLDFGSAVDGPLYYINKKDGSIYSKCGGSCRGAAGKQQEDCQTKCPSKDLNCD